MIFKARYGTGSNSGYQLLSVHLKETAMYAELFAEQIRLSKLALLTALVHDLGKNCKVWQNYLDESQKNGKELDKKDHGTAGGQYLYSLIKQHFGDNGGLKNNDNVYSPCS